MLTLANVLAEVVKARGMRVLVAETRGMSQRGGSVTVHMRIGSVASPLIPRGYADMLISLELIEAARNLSFLKPRGVIITSDTMIVPPIPDINISLDKSYLLRRLTELKIYEIYVIKARELATSIGNVLVENMVMAGALTALKPMSKYVSLNELKNVVAKMRMADVNLKAIVSGHEEAMRLIKSGHSRSTTSSIQT